MMAKVKSWAGENGTNTLRVAKDCAYESEGDEKEKKIK